MNNKAAAAVLALSLISGQSASADAQTGKVELLWLGQAAFLITTPGGKKILIDPFITQNPKTPPELKDLNKLGKIDVVLVTHGHLDHFGDTVAIVKQQHIQMWGPAGLQGTV